MKTYNYFNELEHKVELLLFKDVEKALYNALGYDIDMLSKPSRSQGFVYPRIIFSYICKQEGIGLTLIAKRIKKNHSTIIYYQQIYESYYKSDKIFRILANEVLKKFNEIKNGK